jgi:hypothetical protein
MATSKSLKLTTWLGGLPAFAVTIHGLGGCGYRDPAAGRDEYGVGP